jgi:hypothetical protein
MRVAVVIPWRPTPDRIQAFQAVRDWYTSEFPDWLFGTADNGAEPFSRAGSRNACVRLAEEWGADVVVVNDADTIPERHGVVGAVGATTHGGLHFGLTTMRYLTEDETAAYYRGVPIDRTGRPHDSSVFAITPDNYWRAGGQDERFSGYGGEDNAFHAACQCLLGSVTWHPGAAISLWHDGSCRDIGSERWKPNSELNQRYQRAVVEQRRMRALINERCYVGAVRV